MSRKTRSKRKKLPKREWVYVQRPNQYEVAGCPCGNNDPDWSEFKKHLWCGKCKKDFIPAHNGVFDGPIPVQAAQLMGMSFDRFNLKTQEVEPFELEPPVQEPSPVETQQESTVSHD